MLKSVSFEVWLKMAGIYSDSSDEDEEGPLYTHFKRALDRPSLSEGDKKFHYNLPLLICILAHFLIVFLCNILRYRSKYFML